MNWILNNKVSVIILTEGSNGATLYTKKFKIKTQSINIKVVDTVGAGDSFQAGIFSWLMKNNFLFNKNFELLAESEWSACLNYANKIASLNCMKEGCDPPFEKDLT
jgi:fructokinase